MILILDSYSDKERTLLYGHSIHYSLAQAYWPDANHSGFLTLKSRRRRVFPYIKVIQILLMVGKEHHLLLQTYLNINYYIWWMNFVYSILIKNMTFGIQQTYVQVSTGPLKRCVILGKGTFLSLSFIICKLGLEVYQNVIGLS